VSKEEQLHNQLSDKNLAPSQVPFFPDPKDHYFYYRHTPGRQLSFFSDSVETVLGYSPKNCLEHFFEHLTDSPINGQIQDRITLSLSGKRQPPFEMEISHLNGTVHRLEITMIGLYNDKNELTGVESIAHDISQLHYALSGYKRKSILLDEAENIANMGTWDWNMETDEVRWSPAFYRILNTTIGQVQPGIDSYIQYVEVDDRKLLVNHIVHAIKSNEVFEHSHRLFLANGTIKYVETRGKTLLNAQGYAIRMIGTVHDVTEHIETQSQLEKVYSLINSSVNEIYLFEVDSYRFTFVSEGACRNLGYSQREITQMTPFELCPVIPKIQIMEMMSPVMEGLEELVVFEVSHQRKNGTIYPVEMHLELLQSGGAPQFVAIAQDISSKKQAQEAAREQASLLRSVIDASTDLIFFKDKNSCYLGCNKAFERYVNLSEQEIVGQTDESFFDAKQVKLFHSNDKKVLESGEPRENEEWVSYPDGKKVLLETIKSPYYNQNGEIEGVVGVSSNVTAYMEIQEELRRQKNSFEHGAHYDSLTNLPNRVLFLDRLKQSINKAKRTKEGLALFFIDLDHFKQTNDTLGHDVGDKVLKIAATRLSACVREVDTIARLGGDEFTAILESIRQPQSAALIAHKINVAMQKVINVLGHNLHLSASIGIALYPDNGTTAEALIKCADTAMYRVKQDCRDSFQFYTQDITVMAFERAVMENQLRNALVNKEFCVFYQAQQALDDNHITGVEAYVRWDHPQMGTVLPGKFIKLAEDVGLIQSIDEWVLETACSQMAQWKKQGLGDVRIAVNLAGSDLLHHDFYEHLVQILDKTDCSPSWLELEVTEDCFMGKPDLASNQLGQFNDLGIRLVIYGFGTGYSSVANLRKLPISKLKIDQSFIQNVPLNQDDSAIAQALIGLGKSLGLQVIAEGVETQEQAQFLIAEHCDLAQGYLFGRPVCAADMGDKLGLGGV
jgi:diguanylate cyclase (GGDEF)-like protein/PAS domain S-box-containing protein